MESVGSPEEELKFNTPVPAPHIIHSSSSSPTFLAHVSNLAAHISLLSENDGIESNKDGAQLSNPAAEIILVSENDGIEAKEYGVSEKVPWDKGGKYPSSAVGGIRYHLT